MSFPPNTLQSGKLLPSTFIVESPAIVAAVEVFPFPPANTYPVIDNVLAVSPSVAFPWPAGISLIFTVTFEFIFPNELPP